MRLDGNKLTQKSHRIIVRLKLPMYEFLEEFSRNTKRTISDLVRDALESHYMRIFLGANQSAKELRKMFIEAYGDKGKRIRNLKKIKIRNHF